MSEAPLMQRLLGGVYGLALELAYHHAWPVWVELGFL